MNQKRRTQEEIVAEYDQKIEYHKTQIQRWESYCMEKISKHKNAIVKLEVKKEKTLNPKPRTHSKNTELQKLLRQAKKAGLTEKEIASRLGIELE